MCTIPPLLFPLHYTWSYLVIYKICTMRLLISNLNGLTTSAHLLALFVPFGFVYSAKISSNSEGGRSAGMALVEMEKTGALIAMQALDNLRFMNFYIHVEEI